MSKVTAENLENVMLDTRLDVALESLRFVKAFYGTQRQEYSELETAIAMVRNVQKNLQNEFERKQIPPNKS